MIPYIDNLLAQWALWSMRREDGGTGYARMSLLTASEIGRDYNPCSRPPPGINDSMASEIDRIVVRLPGKPWHWVDARGRRRVMPMDQAIVLWGYCTPSMTVEQKTKELGWSKKDTFYANLHRVQSLVMDALHENSLKNTAC